MVLKKLLRIIPKNPPVPDQDKEALLELHRLTSLSVRQYLKEAKQFQEMAKNAKTSYKKEYYGKKFLKLRPKFQDELTRLHQIEHILKENGIPFDGTAGEVK